MIDLVITIYTTIPVTMIVTALHHHHLHLSIRVLIMQLMKIAPMNAIIGVNIIHTHHLTLLLMQVSLFNYQQIFITAENKLDNNKS